MAANFTMQREMYRIRCNVYKRVITNITKIKVLSKGVPITGAFDFEPQFHPVNPLTHMHHGGEPATHIPPLRHKAAAAASQVQFLSIFSRRILTYGSSSMRVKLYRLSAIQPGRQNTHVKKTFKCNVTVWKLIKVALRRLEDEVFHKLNMPLKIDYRT